ncbi:MAG: hypothetical protein EXR79_17200, partial [Myxococcales bacterium]|nr:hypothetical protein [Myxococcales bacterium]
MYRFVVFAFGLLGACQGSSIPDAPDLEADVESDAAVADLAMPSDSSDPPEVDGSADAQLADTPDAASELDAESDAAPDIPFPCACDDQNACTDDTCDPATGICSHAAKPAGLACDDASQCTQSDTCKAGTCVGQAVDCNDGNPCTSDACGLATGCTTTFVDGSACDDGSPCTQGDKCLGGACLAGVALACPPNEPCIAWKCDPVLGKCKAGYVLAGTACDDGNACTGSEACTDGTCQGKVTTCDDGNPCTDDACSPMGDAGKGLAAGCSHTPNAAPC